MQGEPPRTNRPWPVLTPLVAGLALALVVALVYANSFSRELVFDSATIVGEDPRIRELNGDNLYAIFTQNYWWPNLPSGLYRPLTTLSFLLNYTIFGNGTDPQGYQLVNLLLHWSVALLVFLLGGRLGLARGAALVAAVIFAVHPVATESVTNIVGRADLLAAIAVLGGLIVAWDARAVGWTLRRVALFAGCALGGLFVKENAVVLTPLALALGFAGSSNNERTTTNAPVHWWIVVAGGTVLALGVFGFARWWFTYMNPGGDDPFVDNPLTAAAAWPARLTALRVLADGAAALVAPYSLSPDYSYAQIPVATGGWTNASDWRGSLAALALVAGGIMVVRGWRRRISSLPFLWTAAFVALIPTSNLVVTIGSVRADRFWYLPLAFLALAAAGGIAGLRTALLRRPLLVPVWRGARIVAAAWAVALAVVAHVRTYDWRDNRTLWEAAVIATPGSYKSHMNLGVLLQRDASADRAQLIRAIGHLQTACWILESPPLADGMRVGRPYTGLGDACARLASLEKQADHRNSAADWDRQAETAFRKGLAVAEVVRRSFVETLRARGVQPSRIPVPYGDYASTSYATFLTARDRPTEALALLEDLLAIKPTDVGVRIAAAKAAEAAGVEQRAGEHALWAIVLGTKDRVAMEIAGRVIEREAKAGGAGNADVTVIENGNTVLNLANPLVAARARETFAAIRAHFLRSGDNVGAARLVRVAVSRFGLRLDQP